MRADVTGIVTVGMQDVDLPTDRRGQAWLHFSPHDPARFVPAVAVLEGRAPAERFKDRLVLIGTSAVGLLDLKTTPIDAAMPGVEMHAQALDSMLGGGLLGGRSGRGNGICSSDAAQPRPHRARPGGSAPARCSFSAASSR